MNVRPAAIGRVRRQFACAIKIKRRLHKPRIVASAQDSEPFRARPFFYGSNPSASRITDIVRPIHSADKPPAVAGRGVAADGYDGAFFKHPCGRGGARRPAGNTVKLLMLRQWCSDDISVAPQWPAKAGAC